MNPGNFTCPYPGLRPFKKEEAHLFFGREDQIIGLLEKLGRNQFLAVVGPSGCGKSSLVHAGMIPALEMGFLISGGENWQVAVMRPGSSPMNNLAAAIAPVLYPDAQDVASGRSSIAATLRRGPLGLVEAFKEANLPDDTNLLVVADQFEEIFRFEENHDFDEAKAFVNLLLTARKASQIYVLLTMRSDFMGECARFMGLPEAISESQFLTPRLTREQTRAAITGPASACGGKVETELVNRLLNDMGPDSDQLPLFQHALMRMWTLAEQNSNPVVLSSKEYDAIGGMKHALSKHADEAYEELDEDGRRIAQILFRGLTGGTCQRRDTRRPVRVGDIVQETNASTASVIKVIDIFRRNHRNFLVPPQEALIDEDTIIDISHESLIRHWHRLAIWAKKEKKSAELYYRLQGSALRYQKGKAELWHGRDLQIALSWRDETQPNAQWAKRYGGNFETAMNYLDLSEKKEQRIRRNRFLFSATIVVLIFTTCLMGILVYMLKRESAAKAQAKQQKALAMKIISNLTYELTDKLKDIEETFPILTEIFESNAKSLDEIHELSPESTEALREKAINLERMGDIWLLMKQNDKALESHLKAFKIREKILDSTQDNTRALRDMSVSYNKLGDVFMKKKQYQQALDNYKEDLKISREITKKEPQSIQAKRDLSVTHNKIGDAYLAMGNMNQALQSYKKALDLRKEIAEMVKSQNISSDFNIMRDIMISHIKLGQIHEQLNDKDMALEHYRRTFTVAKQILAQKPDHQAWQDFYSARKNLLNLLFDENKYHEAAQIIKKLIAESETPSAELWGRLAWFLLFSGNYSEAVDAAQKGLSIDPDRTWIATNLAHGWLLSGNYDKAKQVLQTYANHHIGGVPFPDVLLSDYAIFEKKGISHPGFAIMREAIQQLKTSQQSN